jgi:hypothetical protein
VGNSRYVIEIGKDVSEVFEFTTNPVNTPLWLVGVLEETTSTADIDIGTVYRQVRLDDSGKEATVTYIVTGFTRDREFELQKEGTTYSCRYQYESCAAGTRLTYSEATSRDEALDPLDTETLARLKRLVEDREAHP